jgi:hypothetical protein
MKAQSQAFVTEDGTAVKKDDKASSQSIAATTQSEDGSTTSSFKSTNSSSSSSTMMSSGGPMAGDLGSRGGMMPSMGAGGGMDDMMSKMMSNMGSMDMGSGSSMKMGSSSSKMSSSSVSSFSSSSSASSSSMLSGGMSSMLGGGGLSSMPPMRGMEMPGFPSMPGMTIEEMSGPAPGPGPETGGYTVTSPLSPTTHTVGAAADYKAPAAAQQDSSVLLQFREGSDYKLALNMQQYSPEDIAIKLNGRQLTIEAAGHGEQFRQKHTIPDNIDLDAMTSSFSSDGVLVIKAPKAK